MGVTHKFKDWEIGVDTYDRLWVMGKLVGGEAREVKVRGKREKLTGRCYCRVIC